MVVAAENAMCPLSGCGFPRRDPACCNLVIDMSEPALFGRNDLCFG